MGKLWMGGNVLDVKKCAGIRNRLGIHQFCYDSSIIFITTHNAPQRTLCAPQRIMIHHFSYNSNCYSLHIHYALATHI